MFTEFAIFAAFYAVAFVAHFLHARFAKGAHDADNAHRFAMLAAVLAKAFQAALHDYALHMAEFAVHAMAH
jgi:hypothetical protein